jgi:DNA-binding response OmpR family regulator
VRVLVVEDDPAIASAVTRGLRRAALAVDVTHDGETALEKLGVVPYDVLVLDRDVPKVHGDVVCRTVSTSHRATRILMLTAAAAVEDRVAGLGLGADDYLPKPFAMEELVARVRALGRRAPSSRPPLLDWSDIRLDGAQRRVTRSGAELRLANREFALLEALMSVQGDVLSAEQLMEQVWDDRLEPFSNAARVTMLTLRRKLREPPVIETLPGVGYRLTMP